MQHINYYPINGKIVTYKIKFTDSVGFMTSSLSSLTDNLTEGLRKGKCEKCNSGLDYVPQLKTVVHLHSNVWTATKVMKKGSVRA